MIAQYRKATPDDLVKIWAQNIADNPGDNRYIRWRDQFISDNASGAAVTFVVDIDGTPVGEGTLLLSPECRAVRGKPALADGRTTANINALRIRKEFEGYGHISKLMHIAEAYAKDIGITQLTIGVEAQETRNLAIYLHWGYHTFVMSEIEDDTLILYYAKNLTE